MKKFIGYILFAIFAVGCNENKNADAKIEAPPVTDTTQAIKNDATVGDTVQQKNIKIDSVITDTIKPKKINKDSTLLALRKEILTAIKNNDYIKFAGFIHPVDGVRFSPQGYIMIDGDQKFKKDEFINKCQQKIKIKWGAYDGSGDPIQLTIDEYFKRFVYDANFVAPKEIAINKILGKGNWHYNIKDVYNGCDFVDSYFPEIDKKMDGMDWRTLRLVFKKYNGSYCLVGVIHDEWAI